MLVYRRHGFGQKRARATIVEIALFVREVVREFWNIEGTSRAASLAYTTLLSLIPLVVAFTHILKQYFANLFPGFGVQIDTILNAVVPYRSPQITYHLARFAENAATASTVGAIVFMFVAFRLFLAVEGAVNQIWKVRSARGYRSKIMAFTMLFFWGPLLMGLSFTTTAMLERNRYLRILFEGDLIFMVVPVVVLFIGFTMLFWLVPSTRVRVQAAMAGALVTTVLFTLVRCLFGIYSAYLMSGRLNFIYGAVGLAVIFLIAIEVMWVVILLGVEVSFVWQNLYGVLRATEAQVQDQPQFDLYFALRGLLEISRRFDRREEPPSDVSPGRAVRHDRLADGARAAPTRGRQARRADRRGLGRLRPRVRSRPHLRRGSRRPDGRRDAPPPRHRPRRQRARRDRRAVLER